MSADTAEAIHEGMAEPTMYLHYMRSKAESLTNVIFDYSSNSILFLDGDMNIIELNSACEEVFSVKAENIRNLQFQCL